MADHLSDSLDLAEEWLTGLRENGYRPTGTRRAVVETIAGSTRALTPTEIYDLARQRCPSLGLVTVYRTLARLEELGLVQRVHMVGDCHAYLAAVTGHQHLLICQNCGRAEVFDGDRLDPLIERVEKESGFLVREHWLQLFGLCASCQPVEKSNP
jgi:Fur family ferric uptake transcriptional regulator